MIKKETPWTITGRRTKKGERIFQDNITKELAKEVDGRYLVKLEKGVE